MGLDHGDGERAFWALNSCGGSRGHSRPVELGKDKAHRQSSNGARSGRQHSCSGTNCTEIATSGSLKCATAHGQHPDAAGSKRHQTSSGTNCAAANLTALPKPVTGAHGKWRDANLSAPSKCAAAAKHCHKPIRGTTDIMGYTSGEGWGTATARIQREPGFQ